MTSTLSRKSRSGYTLVELFLTIFLTVMLLGVVVIGCLLIGYLYTHM